MAVTSCHLIDDSCSLTDRQFRYSAKYRVACDTRDDSAQQVLLGAAVAAPQPIPPYFSTYSLNGGADPNVFSQDYEVRRISSDGSVGCWWEISVNWGPLDNPTDTWTTDQDPLTRPVRIEPYSEEIEEIVEEAYCEDELTGIGVAVGDFVAVTNAAGQENGSPLTRSRRISGLKFIKNVASIAAFNTLRDTFEDKLNDGNFYDAGEKQVLCRSIDCSPEMFAGGTTYREVTINCLFKPEGWYTPIVNRGYKVLKDIDGDTKLVEATEWSERKNGEVPVAEPVNLELDGTQVADGQTGTAIRWRIQDTADFSGLGVGGV